MIGWFLHCLSGIISSDAIVTMQHFFCYIMMSFCAIVSNLFA